MKSLLYYKQAIQSRIAALINAESDCKEIMSNEDFSVR